MPSLSRFPAILFACVAFGAQAAVVVNVPGPPAIQSAVKGATARDRLARQSATSFVLENLVRVQAGTTPTPAQSALIAEHEKFRAAVENENEALLPISCRGRDCEERYAFNRCIAAYQFSSAFYRAVYDHFFDAAAQKSLTSRLSSGAGTVWQGAIAMAPGSQPLDKLPAASRDCAGGGAGSGVTTAQAAAGQPNEHDELLKKARAAGVDTTVLGLRLGEPVKLPLCPDSGLFGALFRPGVTETCIRNDQELMALAVEMSIALTGQEMPAPFDVTVAMPTAKCPDWVSGCTIQGRLVDGKLVSVLVLTNGLDVQDEVAAALVKKYKAWTTMGIYHWLNDVTGDKVDSHDIYWNLVGINVHFKGYTGGQRDGLGSILVETDAVTRERDAAEKARQARKQQL